MRTELEKTKRLSNFLDLADGLLTRNEFKTAFSNITKMVQMAIAQLNASINQKIATMQDGYTPVKGKDYFDGYTPIKNKDYFDGKTPIAGIDFEVPKLDEVALTKKVTEEVMSKTLAELEKRIPSLSLSIRDALELLPQNEKPSISVIKGLQEHITGIVTDVVSKHAYSGGGGASVSVLSSGTMKVQTASAFNFKGAGAPTVSIGSNGVTNLDFSNINGFQKETPTGAVDGTNTTFIVLHIPDHIISGGGTYFENNGYTRSGLNITMSQPPAAVADGGFIISFYLLTL